MARPKIAKRVYRAKEQNEERLRRLPNVEIVMVGKKMVKGVQTDEDAVIVGVTKKKHLRELSANELVPLRLGDVKTDVIEVGKIEFLGAEPGQIRKPISLVERTRLWWNVNYNLEDKWIWILMGLATLATISVILILLCVGAQLLAGFL